MASVYDGGALEREQEMERERQGMQIISTKVIW